MRLFLDTNIILDIIEERIPFVADSTAVLVLAEQLGSRLFIAWHGLATTYYIIRRGRSEEASIREIDKILGWANVAPVTSSSAARARAYGLPDFEDAMQCVSAENCLAELIVTRNLKDFALRPVPAISPLDFLSRYRSS